jgi:alkylation response protein AidB-like acyl-CoA dehydrogenase
VLFAEECARAGVPRQFHFIGPELVGPVLIAHGTEAQRERWLPPLRTGEHMWCQLFSEPDAGSDLASLRTTATAQGDVWVIDGRKVWSSGAASADLGLLLARTGPERLALSMFAVPMSAPGVEVRPIGQMDGDSRFGEIALDQVELGSEALIGGVGDGWKVAMTTLGNERVNLGGQAVALFAALDEVLAMVPARSAISSDEAASLWIRIWLLRANFQRLLGSGRPASDPQYSMLKLSGSELGRDLSRFSVGLLGAAAVAGRGELAERSTWFLAQPGQTIAGGTSEIQRNILAERVLGLPR